MNDYTNLSAFDRVVMEVLWAKGEMSNADIVKALNDKEWSRHIIRVYLLRLTEKGMVGINQISPRKHTYYPLISRDDFIAGETSAYLKARYNGLAHMVAGLALGKKVTDNELDELEQFLQDYRKKGN